MKILLFVITTLFALTSIASNTCLNENVFLYKSIECCLSDSLTENLCIKKIDELDSKLISQIQTVKQDIFDNKFESNKIPNCFWLSLSFFNNSLLNQPGTINESPFLNELEENFFEISLSQLNNYDLVYYEGNYDFIHDFLNDGYPIEVSTPFHAGIYIGEGLILQKENNSDSIFSLVSLKESFKGYSTAFKDMRKNYLKIKFYRKY